MTNLIKALTACSFPIIGKDAVNPHFMSKYASLPAVLEAVDAELRRNGLRIVQTYEGESLRTTLWHVSGESISGVQPLLMVKHDAQGLASASTYARRYGILAILNLAAEDDDGEHATHPPINEKAIMAQLRADAYSLFQTITKPSVKLVGWHKGIGDYTADQLRTGIAGMKKIKGEI